MIGHRGAITSLDFHPDEFLLASGSADGTVRFWDLETLKVVSTTEAEARAPAVLGTSFTPDGRALLVATKEQVKVVGWEPQQVFDAVQCKLDDIMDFGVAASSSHLITCSVASAKPSNFVAQGLDLGVIIIPSLLSSLAFVLTLPFSIELKSSASILLPSN